MTYSSEIDPNIVFKPEYWDNPSAPIEDILPATTWISLFNARLAMKSVVPMVPSVVDGRMTGAQVNGGAYYNPADELLARTSSINYPGTILLADTELVWPLWAQSKKPRNIDHLTLSARGLLGRDLGENSDRMEYGQKSAYYDRDGFGYLRRVAILMNIPNGSKGVLPFFLSKLIVNQESGKTLYCSMRSSTGYAPRRVDQSEAFINQGTVTHARRLRSLEVIATGAPAVAVNPAFRFLGSVGLPV